MFSIQKSSNGFNHSTNLLPNIVHTLISSPPRQYPHSPTHTYLILNGSISHTQTSVRLIWPDFCSALIVGRLAPLGLHNTRFRSVPVSCSPRTGADASSPRHETHRNVANSRSLKSWKGLRRQTSSVLYAPSALSAMAFVLLQCLFDRFGSVFPQCGLMVFPGAVIVSR